MCDLGDLQVARPACHHHHTHWAPPPGHLGTVQVLALPLSVQSFVLKAVT